MKRYLVRTFSLAILAIGGAQAQQASELGYEAWIDSDNRMKCMYGYFADKTGDHAAAVRIFEDCIERWDDVYSMIWLAQIHETGVGLPRNIEKATALMKRGANTNDAAGYSSLARYHYGVALMEGYGVQRDREQGMMWLERAADEQVQDAINYLQALERGEGMNN